MNKPSILFIIGSTSDLDQIKDGIDLMKKKEMNYKIVVKSAHRNLTELLECLKNTTAKVIIAAAGLSAALPGVVASQVDVPVIGIPLISGSLSGIDALLSILQTPKGIPVATMGIGKQGVLNAVYLAERILNLKETE